MTITYTPGPPSVTVASPTEGQSFTRGQAVTTEFTCADHAAGPGIATCVDDRGRPSGAVLDTSTAGEHTFTVVATSGSGRSAARSVTYTVKPDPVVVPAPLPPVMLAPFTRGPTPAPVAPVPELCRGMRVALVDVARRGRRVHVAGLADRSVAGQRVTLVGDRKVETSVRIAADGTFRGSLPARGGRRFHARLANGDTSRAFRLQRRLRIVGRATRAKTTTVTLALANRRRGVTADVYRQTSCTRRTKIGELRFSSRGRARLKLRNPRGDDAVALYRVVAGGGRGRAYSLPIAVLAR